jgi:undecaprenyl-diphosphatase
LSNFLIWEIILLSIIQGTTEFFPISSSGHLVLAQKLLNIREPQILLNIVLHLGTLFAIVIYLKEEIKELIIGFKNFLLYPAKELKTPQIRTIFQIIIATVPTVLIGYFFNKPLEKAFGSLRAVSISLLITGLFLFITKFSKEKKNNRLILHPLIIGIFQGMAIVPGLSRSGFTIGVALLLGWERERAAKFSFLIFIPAIIGAFIFEISKIQLYLQNLLILLFGFIMTFIVGILSLTFLMKVIKKGSFSSFSLYCFIIGLLALLLSFITK